MDQILKELCSIRGISGDEKLVQQKILKEIGSFADSISITPLGSILAHKKGKYPAKTKLLISAHMDEVGMIVTHIGKEGLLHFTTVGGIDPRVLAGRTVKIGDHEIPGVIGMKPIHVLSAAEREKTVPVEDLAIDIGASGKEEASSVVSPGDSVTFERIFYENGHTIMSPALDDRAGCAVLIFLMQKVEWKYDTDFLFAVQEEVGLNGSKTAAFADQPQASIVVEVTTAADVAGMAPENRVCALEKGPVISFMDKRTIYDREYCRMAFEEAQKAGIPCQYKQAVAGGNDAGAIHISRSGIRTVAVSLPGRYLHSPMSVISRKDYEDAKSLIALMAERIAGE